MRFRITRHSGHAVPLDALELLLRRLGARRGEVSFMMSRSEIWARWDDGDASSATREAKAEAHRWEIFEIVREACEDARELQVEWFAVSQVR